MANTYVIIIILILLILFVLLLPNSLVSQFLLCTFVFVFFLSISMIDRDLYAYYTSSSVALKANQFCCLLVKGFFLVL